MKENKPPLALSEGIVSLAPAAQILREKAAAQKQAEMQKRNAELQAEQDKQRAAAEQAALIDQEKARVEANRAAGNYDPRPVAQPAPAIKETVEVHTTRLGYRLWAGLLLTIGISIGALGIYLDQVYGDDVVNVVNKVKHGITDWKYLLDASLKPGGINYNGNTRLQEAPSTPISVPTPIQSNSQPLIADRVMYGNSTQEYPGNPPGTSSAIYCETTRTKLTDRIVNQIVQGTGAPYGPDIVQINTVPTQFCVRGVFTGQK